MRIVQWATGIVGARGLRAVIEHPSFELVGVKVHSDAKAGVDAGELCGLPPVGVAATQSIDDVIALAPDCVLYMQEGTDVDDLCRLLEAGINVVTTRGDFHFPPRMNPDVRARVEAACAAGGTSIHSTGVSPGFSTEALPLVLASLQRRLDTLTIDEFADIAPSVSAEMAAYMGFGQPAGSPVDPIMLEYTADGFSGSLAVVADALGYEFESVEATGETVAALSGVEGPDGFVVEAGTVGLIRLTIAGMVAGRQLVRFRCNWYYTKDVAEGFEVPVDNGWRIHVAGDAPLDLLISLPVTGDEPVKEQMAGYTAHRAVNAVPAVVAAAPGIRTSSELPQFHPQLA